MIRELAYEAFSRAFWATMGTLARLAFWALGETLADPAMAAGKGQEATAGRCPDPQASAGPSPVTLGNSSVTGAADGKRASRATPMPIAPEARVPFNAGKYGSAEDDDYEPCGATATLTHSDGEPYAQLCVLRPGHDGDHANHTPDSPYYAHVRTWPRGAS